ncbi:hypothetical protein K402DRAFT_457546 [Aulographum hederae CBS 113979]|uniref:Uncharacterized protein n=1 Tax=Aulographum hederae CBS 113979 TaxID=1176131 RepID=A0A6G1GMF6_9PEZI|nr:hypothetical protein K402DRAFT_457546 [Aulographum hederae CBS 113979]
MLASRWATKVEPEAQVQPVPEPEQAPPAQETEAVPVPEPVPEPSYNAEPQYEADYSTMDQDEFAQTRAPDDLFDDDFTPIAEPIVEEQPPEVEPEVVPTAPAQNREGFRGGRGGLARSRHSTSTTAPASTPNSNAPIAPSRPTTNAVRGDRTATGGVKKPKLTTEELNAKFEAMAVKNKSLEAAHKAERADFASFQAREDVAAQMQKEKQKEDRQNRQQMMGEREKWRQRKLNALGGREWDAEKNEEDYSGGRTARRGAHGGIAGPAPARTEREQPAEQFDDRDYIHDDRRGGHRGRGAGGRGGRGRGRGGVQEQDRRKEQAPPKASDFPELPAASAGTKKSEDSSEVKPPPTVEFPKKKTEKLEMPSPAQEKKSWADEVAGTLSPT